MTLFEKMLFGADALGVIAFAAIFVLARRRGWEIRNATGFFFLWATVYLFEYYFLGENSYIHMDDEGDHFIPYYMYLLNGHLGGQFGHALGGGNDVYSAFSPGIQLVSPELIWFSLFPVWIAILVHKAIIVSVGFWGDLRSDGVRRGHSKRTKNSPIFVLWKKTSSNRSINFASHHFGNSIIK